METTDKIKIFLVDDDKMFASALKHSLAGNKIHPHEIMTFPTGEECIKNLRKHNPEIIILDYNLNKNYPDAIDGVQVLKRIKRISPNSEVIMLSSQENINVAMDTLNHGAYDYVTKGESAFIKIKNTIMHISFEIKSFETMEKESRRFGKMTLLFVIGLLLLLFLLTHIF